MLREIMQSNYLARLISRNEGGLGFYREDRYDLVVVLKRSGFQFVVDANRLHSDSRKLTPQTRTDVTIRNHSRGYHYRPGY